MANFLSRSRSASLAAAAGRWARPIPAVLIGGAWWVLSLARTPSFPLPALLALALVFSGATSSTAQTVLNCGTVVNGSIDAPLELDTFTFTAEAGDIVTITFLQTLAVDAGFSVRGLVYTPGGVLFANLTTLVGGINNLAIAQPGTYTLRVSDSDSTKRGSYAVGLTWLLPASKRCGSQTPLGCGQVVNASVSAPLELDTFTFTAEAGDIVTITFLQTLAVDAGFSVRGLVYTPAGGLFANLTTLVGGINNLAITQPGTYTLRVSDSDSTKRGSYAVGLTWLLPASKRCGSQTPLGCGQVVNASISAPLELDLFTFTAEAGEIVTITFLQTLAIDAGFSVRGLVYTPTGVLFANLTTLVGGINNLAIKQPGTYTLRVSDSDSTRRGSYAVGLTWLLPANKPCGSTTPTMTLDKTSLRFGAVTNGTAFLWQTAAQAVRLTQTGTGTVTWTATSNQPWLQVSPVSGTGPANLSIGVVSVGGLPVSTTLTGAITLTLTGASNTVGPIAVSLNLASNATSTGPFGFVDTPLDNTTGVTGAIPVTGWALDDVEVTRVMICRAAFGAEVAPVDPNCGGAAQIFVGFAVFIDGARTDVAGLYPTYPLFTRAGWGFMVLTNMLPNQGNGTYVFYLHAQDRDGHTMLLGTRTLTCANASATKPFGAIDTPTQGGPASGAGFINFGWALTPQPKIIPIDGSTITVMVDGAALGPVDYNHERPDIETLFPGFQNTAGANGAVGFRVIDTTTLTNGLHTISWTVTDSLGITEGIGSRFFTVTNGAGAPVTAAVDGATGAAGARARTTMARAEEIAAAPRDDAPVLGRRGWDLEAPWRWYGVGGAGRAVIRGEEVDRFELALGEHAGAHYTGYVRVGEALARLPIGSQLDATTGAFTWAPGVGFVGRYDLVFVRWVGTRAVARHEVRVILAPKGSGYVGVQVAIDTPRAQQYAEQPFVLAGWAADLDAATGTGIDTLHVWAYPSTGGTPVFLGTPTLGGPRPDVAAVHGEQFAASGFELTLQGLSAGTYDLAVFPWSNVTGAFAPPRIVHVTVR